MLTDAEMYARMENGWRAGKPETVCGNGSLLEHTQNIRAWLPDVARRYRLYTICDAGAGDLHWISHMQWSGVWYRAYDLIPRRPEVSELDITREALPVCEAVLCRMVLNHLDTERILLALQLFRSAARYLIATQFRADELPQRSPQFARLDLARPPFGLGEPLEAVQDGAESFCSLALWRL